jgi:hypothetical protein
MFMWEQVGRVLLDSRKQSFAAVAPN